MPISNAASSQCELSPHDRFISTFFTLILAAINTAVTGGPIASFCAAWLSWFATLRVLATGVFYVKNLVIREELGEGVQELRRVPLLGRIITAKGRLSRRTYGYTALAPPSYEQATQLDPTLEDDSVHNSEPSSPSEAAQSKTPGSPTKQVLQLNSSCTGLPSVLEWTGWIYMAIYCPVVQSM